MLMNIPYLRKTNADFISWILKQQNGLYFDGGGGLGLVLVLGVVCGVCGGGGVVWCVWGGWGVGGYDEEGQHWPALLAGERSPAVQAYPASALLAAPRHCPP